jgi:hypothetical protein
MHKDSPPGAFDFERRSLRYTISLGLFTGFILSIFVYGAVVIWRADRGAVETPKASAGAIEAATAAARRRAPPTPAPTAAVQY